MSLVDRIKDLGLEAKKLNDGTVLVEVPPEGLRKAAEALLEIGFDHLLNVEGVDLPAEGKIELTYYASSYESQFLGKIVALRTKLSRESPKVETLIDVWPNGLYMERETWELLGIEFEGHPELKHLLLPPWWSDIPPLRKEFKIKEEGYIIDLTK